MNATSVMSSREEVDLTLDDCIGEQNLLQVTQFPDNLTMDVDSSGASVSDEGHHSDQKCFDPLKDPLESQAAQDYLINLLENDVDELRRQLQQRDFKLAINYKGEKDGQSLLICCLSNLHASDDTIKLLLQHGADVTYPRTLELATRHRENNVVKLIFEYDINHGISLCEMNKALKYVNRKDMKLKLLLMKKYVRYGTFLPYSLSLYAIRKKHTRMIRKFLEYSYSDYQVAGIDFKFMNEDSNSDNIHRIIKNDGRTSLIAACILGEFEIINVCKLIESSPTSYHNMRDKYGWTALMYAICYGYTNIVELLLDENFNIYIQNNYGATAYTIAQYLHRDEIMKLLLGKDMQNKLSVKFNRHDYANISLTLIQTVPDCGEEIHMEIQQMLKIKQTILIQISE